MEAFLHLTVPQIWNDLPPLFDADWPRVERELWELLRKLESGDSTARKLIVNLFAAYPPANARLEHATANLALPQVKSLRHPAGASQMERYVIVPVMYGTDRQQKGDGYGGEPNQGSLSLGVARVSVPEDHRMGETEHPPWWKFGFGWDPGEHVQLLSVDTLVHAEFVARTRGMLEQASRNEALVFIHGFNVSFEDAARRAAQLAFDLRFKGVSMFYSWPSRGVFGKKWYHVDEDKVMWTRPRLQQFLTMAMTELGVDSVHVIAHSMGNRALTEVLKDLSKQLPDKAARLRQVVFAAPDINAQTFKDLADEFCDMPERCTLYASSKDKALQYAKKIHKSARAGDSGGYLVLMNGIDTVDVTNVDTSFLKHSYYGDNTSILSDLDVLIRHGHPPDERPRLTRHGQPAMPYWEFLP